MAAEAEAAREARAKVMMMIMTPMIIIMMMKVIAAEGEKKASQALREAADTISESPAALQLRYLQVTKPSTTKLGHGLLQERSLKYFVVSDPELHLGGEELHHNFPIPNRPRHPFIQ